MSQEPINIAGVCAFPNPNGVRDMRFVDCNYNTLFRLPNHSSIIMTKPDGTQMKQQCSYIDDYHIYIGQCGFHIMEFAEMAWRNGYTYLPEHPREQDCCDTYALYQIKDVIRTDYFCCAYPKILATCRSYNISLNIIVQNIAQIKNIYEKEWESIIGNCDTLLFLGGGNEPTSLEFMSKLLGKETLDTRTRGLTRGHSGSSSTNYQQAGRELMMQEEIRLMDTDDSILLIRGECPVLDKKYDLMKHPNIKLTEDGGAAPYVHKSLPTKFEVSDLPYDFRSLDDYQFDTMEEFDHENPDEDEEE